jgi:hypothetical protein
MRVLLAAAMAAPTSVFAQTVTGAIAGSVKDESGAVLPGVVVSVTSDAPGNSAQAVTDQQGAYRVEGLAPGSYRVQVALDGFETEDRRVTVAAGQTQTTDVALSPAKFSQSVVVTARRVEEQAQDVPIPVSVVRSTWIA